MPQQDFFSLIWTAVGDALAGDLAQQAAAQAAIIADEVTKSEIAAKERGKEFIGESSVLTAARRAKSDLEASIVQWRAVEWRSAEERYRRTLREHVSTTRLLGHPKPVRIDQLYTDVFVYEQILAVRRTNLRLADPGNDPYTFNFPYERRNARELVDRGGHVYVLGHPGAGKTTFLKYITVLACEAKIPRTPIYVPLRDVSQLKLGVREYMNREFDICGLPAAAQFCDRLLNEADTLLLIDGLDEVQDVGEVRKKIILEIIELARRHPRAQLVVTCRIAASDYAFEQFTYCEVAQFTTEQQKSFIQKWYAAEEDLQSTLLASWDSPRVAPLRDLAKTPLLLALICLAFDDLGEIPERRTDLYRDAIETLLRRWDSSRSIRRDPFYAGLPSARREQLLQELAWNFHAENRILFSPEIAAPIVNKWFAKLPDSPLHETGATAELLDQIEAQHGLVVQRAAGIYSFSHLSLQEFFTARSIAHGHPFNTIERIVKAHFAEPRWREVFVFLAGLLPDGSGFLERLRASAASAGAQAPEVNLFINRVMGEYTRRESQWRAQRPGEDTMAFYAGKSPARIALNALATRLEELKWIGPRSGLRLKLLVADQLLAESEDKPKHFVFAAANSEHLVSYFQSANLALDCATVAVCDNRERAVSWILTPLHS